MLCARTSSGHCCSPWLACQPLRQCQCLRGHVSQSNQTHLLAGDKPAPPGLLWKVMLSSPDGTAPSTWPLTLQSGHTCLPGPVGQSSEAIVGTVGP